ncbi:hypothetical protein [uncultured Parolsenella sp.]|uniref:hypothetical protein n=1 Tax=uncultured Parolsenella sp. TaxID=2083008 RepID=UPI0027D98F39|nr:hypothetical protein [uncultured Parolsenella sp.]
MGLLAWRDLPRVLLHGGNHPPVLHGGTGGRGQSSDEESSAEWVAEIFESVTVGGATLYDLTQPLS